MKETGRTLGEDPELSLSAMPDPETPDRGAMVDEHGRSPGVPSRTGTGSTAPPADPERVKRADGATRGDEVDDEGEDEDEGDRAVKPTGRRS
ncbi:hypothetical protein SAVIM338S_00313 [Streptomyces avidinii]